jgi:hypothetical protein
MPYKERLKKGVERKKEKVKYNVTNWTQYNQSLRRIGMISLIFHKAILKLSLSTISPMFKEILGG